MMSVARFLSSGCGADIHFWLAVCQEKMPQRQKKTDKGTTQKELLPVRQPGQPIDSAK
jgi:hypothetical protein